MNRHTLEDDLLQHANFRKRLKAKHFALDAYHYLRNPIMHEDGSRHSLSLRSIGEVIAELRDENEDYIDFYLSDMGLTAAELAVAGQFDNEIAGLLAEIGWTALTVEEEVALYKEAMRILVNAEKEPERVTATWYASNFGESPVTERPRGSSPYQRLRYCAFTGRVSREECEFVMRHIFLSERAASYAVDYTP